MGVGCILSSSSIKNSPIPFVADRFGSASQTLTYHLRTTCVPSVGVRTYNLVMSRTVIAVVEDMLFASKIRATAEAMGVKVVFPRSKETLLEQLKETPTALVIFDLHNRKIDSLDLAKEIKRAQPQVSLLGFFSHVETELQRNAMAAGFDRVIPRSVFSRDLADILAD